MKRMAPMILALLPLLGGCEKKPSATEYANRSFYAQEANDISAAEAALQEGLVKFPGDGGLEAELRALYIKTRQWDKFERWLDLSIGKVPYWHREIVANGFFEDRNWPRAHRAYVKLAEAHIRDAGGEGACSVDAVTSYRNAAAAADNMRNRQAVYDAAVEITKFKNYCVDGDLSQVIAKQDEVAGWLVAY